MGCNVEEGLAYYLVKIKFVLYIQDGTVRIWDVVLGRTLLSLTGHLQSVTCVKWGGEGLIYTASQDRTIKVWRPDDVSTESVQALIFRKFMILETKPLHSKL